ncbi:nodulation protein NodN [Roseibium aquae]|uniref:Nodulation protein NodN n=1 Tax=Roseibium aquae TaxID=1323746 RepID=A0A916X2A9_9HYPH|nr:MaoC family dehydratase [Roseibium aquae]GGB61149.1 nodulation protein NodN [Roseibium aquae]
MTVDLRPGPVTRSELEQLVGKEVGVSRWFELDQSRIDAFARVTEDHQFIHVDPERAAQTAFGGTIAHGFLTLSMLSAMGVDAQPRIADQVMAVNYGFDRVRFLAPVMAGDRVRGRFTLETLAEKASGQVDIGWGVTVEIDGRDRPALAAVWLNRFILGSAEN